MKIFKSKNSNLKELSIWIFSLYILGMISVYIIVEFLGEILNNWIFKNLKLFLVLFLLGLVVMSLINSVKFLRKSDFRKHIKWFILGAVPFIIFVIGIIASFNWINIFLSIFD